jgi:hypothetical protein
MSINMDKRSRFLILVIIGISVICCVLGVIILRPTRVSTSMDLTLYAFAEALRLNHRKALRSLVVAEQQGRLDAWVAHHEAFRCPFSLRYSLDPDYSRTYWVCSLHEEITGPPHCDYRFRCVYPDGSYAFWVDAVVTQRVEGKYQVVEWEKACERIKKEEEEQWICQSGGDNWSR